MLEDPETPYEFRPQMSRRRYVNAPQRPDSAASTLTPASLNEALEEEYAALGRKRPPRSEMAFPSYNEATMLSIRNAQAPIFPSLSVGRPRDTQSFLGK